MKPSSLRSSARRIFSLEAGMSHFSCSARLALRIRVRRSATGSLRIPLPARFHDARDLALEGELAEAQPAHLELPEVAPGPAAQLAAGIGARRELRRRLRFHDQRGLGHCYCSLNGMPRCVRSALASSSERAVVTKMISMPRTLSILSYTISGKMSCSRRPSA